MPVSGFLDKFLLRRVFVGHELTREFEVVAIHPRGKRRLHESDEVRRGIDQRACGAFEHGASILKPLGQTLSLVRSIVLGEPIDEGPDTRNQLFGGDCPGLVAPGDDPTHHFIKVVDLKRQLDPSVR